MESCLDKNHWNNWYHFQTRAKFLNEWPYNINLECCWSSGQFSRTNLQLYKAKKTVLIHITFLTLHNNKCTSTVLHSYVTHARVSNSVNNLDNNSKLQYEFLIHTEKHNLSGNNMKVIFLLFSYSYNSWSPKFLRP